MSLKDLDVKVSYISCGEENMVDALLVPALKESVYYKRSVGFFSSSVFEPIINGIIQLSRNGGKIQLIASPRLSEEDVEAINIGYKNRVDIIENAFTQDFITEIENLNDTNLKLLSELIASNILDIKIAVNGNAGIYHDKLGILEDCEGNAVVFYGSPNETYSGYECNYEKIRVIKSWDISSKESIEDEKNEFDSLWNGTNPFVTTYNYVESAKENIIKVIKRREDEKKKSKNDTPIKLRDYQEEAINAWVQNSFRGFYVMATGTGKTWTAIFSAKKLLEDHSAMIVICAPYKHLIKQWSEDVVKAFPNAKIVMVSSENPNWETQIKLEIIRKQYNPENQIIILSTIASFKKERFSSLIETSKEEKLLIVDEAHRFTERPESLKEIYNYLLGLSATPYSGRTPQKGLELMKWFGGQVFNLPIEVALERGFLVPYNYYPIFVNATAEEEEKFSYFTQKILSCFKNNKCINPDLLVKSLRSRLRVISMASKKQEQLDSILDNICEKDHFVVYCGDGREYNEEYHTELRHIQTVKRILTKHGYKASQFTATENMNERMQLVDAFNKNEISALAAIRCLDEGINIPSIKSALIISSNDDYREFVQRRGRILRTYKDKKYANIYDIIVLPSSNMQGWAKIELRRFHEYARLAQNWSSLKRDLYSMLDEYYLSLDDVDVYDYEGMEEVEDE